MDENISQQEHRLLYGSALALIPAFAYALAFIYEQAWGAVFHLPKEFIVIGWTNIIIAAGAFIGTSGALLFTILYLPHMLRQIGFLAKPDALNRRVVRHSSMLLWATLVFMRYAAFIPLLALIYSLLIYLMLIDFVFPLLSQRRERYPAIEINCGQKTPLQSYLPLPSGGSMVTSSYCWPCSYQHSS